MLPSGPQPSASEMSDSNPKLAPHRLRRFVAQVFEAEGCPRRDSRELAEALTWADVHGISALGAAKVPLYVERLRAGGTNVSPTMRFGRPGSLSWLDADGGFGQVAGRRAVDSAIRRAVRYGAAAVVVRNSSSAGALGYIADRAARRGMIALVVTNSQPLMAPSPNSAAVVGNQAFAIAVPTRRHSRVVFDTATSAISIARLRALTDLGEPAPPGVGIDASGGLTVDPRRIRSGALLPVAGYRGFGLAVFWELLTGALGGGTSFGSSVEAPERTDRRQGVSLFVMAIDPDSFVGSSAFRDRADHVIDRVVGTNRSSTPPRIPGERRQRLAAESRRTGVTLSDEVALEFASLAATHGISL